MSSDPLDRPDAQVEPLEVLTFGPAASTSIHCRLALARGRADIRQGCWRHHGERRGGGARLGRKAAIITGVGDDPFGRYVRRALRELNVDDRHVVTNTEYATPVTFCEIFSPDNFPLVLPQADRTGPADQALGHRLRRGTCHPTHVAVGHRTE